MRVVSKVPTIRIRVVDVQEDFFCLKLANLSSVAATGFAIDDKDVSQMYIGPRLPYLISAGDTYQLELGKPGLADEVAQSLVLLAALFADGHWAGEVSVAARIAALQIGAEEQRKRINGLFERIRSDLRISDDAKLALIRTELDLLPEDPPAQALRQVLARFPDLQKDAVDSVMEELRSGLHVTKQVCSFGLRDFERNGIRSCPAPSLFEWWNEFSARTPRSFCSMRA